MKKLLAVLLIIVVFLCGCNAKQDSDEENRFVVEYKQRENLSYIVILRDTQTGVAYLYVKNGYSGGLTQLVEVDNGCIHK